MRNFKDNEFLKIFRRMVYWEWYTDVNTTKLFLHCLLMANWKDGRWRGIEYKRGQFFTSLDSLSKETGLTIQEVRTALEHLTSTNEVTCETTNRYTLISVVSFDKYQGEQQAEQQTNNKRINKQSTSDQHANQQQNKNIKNNKNNKEIEEEIDPIFLPEPDDLEGEDEPDFWKDDDGGEDE